ncbi:hypothetical protein HK104_005193 [Borealophlyctis nickersoniae]|nr:hypothetical protein HK104_005193 [Borealophlyctis nickersoniae]
MTGSQLTRESTATDGQSRGLAVVSVRTTHNHANLGQVSIAARRKSDVPKSRSKTQSRSKSSSNTRDRSETPQSPTIAPSSPPLDTQPHTSNSAPTILRHHSTSQLSDSIANFKQSVNDLRTGLRSASVALGEIERDRKRVADWGVRVWPDFESIRNLKGGISQATGTADISSSMSAGLPRPLATPTTKTNVSKSVPSFADTALTTPGRIWEVKATSETVAIVPASFDISNGNKTEEPTDDDSEDVPPFDTPSITKTKSVTFRPSTAPSAMGPTARGFARSSPSLAAPRKSRTPLVLENTKPAAIRQSDPLLNAASPFAPPRQTASAPFLTHSNIDESPANLTGSLESVSRLPVRAVRSAEPLSYRKKGGDARAMSDVFERSGVINSSRDSVKSPERPSRTMDSSAIQPWGEGEDSPMSGEDLLAPANKDGLKKALATPRIGGLVCDGQNTVSASADSDKLPEATKKRRSTGRHIFREREKSLAFSTWDDSLRLSRSEPSSEPWPQTPPPAPSEVDQSEPIVDSHSPDTHAAHQPARKPRQTGYQQRTVRVSQAFCLRPTPSPKLYTLPYVFRPRTAPQPSFRRHTAPVSVVNVNAQSAHVASVATPRPVSACHCIREHDSGLRDLVWAHSIVGGHGEAEEDVKEMEQEREQPWERIPVFSRPPSRADSVKFAKMAARNMEGKSRESPEGMDWEGDMMPASGITETGAELQTGASRNETGSDISDATEDLHFLAITPSPVPPVLATPEHRPATAPAVCHEKKLATGSQRIAVCDMSIRVSGLSSILRPVSSPTVKRAGGSTGQLGELSEDQHAIDEQPLRSESMWDDRDALAQMYSRVKSELEAVDVAPPPSASGRTRKRRSLRPTAINIAKQPDHPVRSQGCGTLVATSSGWTSTANMDVDDTDAQAVSSILPPFEQQYQQYPRPKMRSRTPTAERALVDERRDAVVGVGVAVKELEAKLDWRLHHLNDESEMLRKRGVVASNATQRDISSAVGDKASQAAEEESVSKRVDEVGESQTEGRPPDGGEKKRKKRKKKKKEAKLTAPESPAVLEPSIAEREVIPQTVYTPTNIIPDPTGTKALVVENAEPVQEEEAILWPPPAYIYAVAKAIVEIDKGVASFQKRVRGFLCRKWYRHAIDVLYLTQRLFRAHRIYMQYQRILQLIHGKRNHVLALKQLDRLDAAAIVAGIGEHRPPPLLTSSSVVSESTFSLTTATSNLDVKSERLNPVEHRVRIYVRNQKKGSKVHDLDEGKRKLWEEYQRACAQISKRYAVWLDRMRKGEAVEVADTKAALSDDLTEEESELDVVPDFRPRFSEASTSHRSRRMTMHNPMPPSHNSSRRSSEAPSPARRFSSQTEPPAAQQTRRFSSQTEPPTSQQTRRFSVQTQDGSASRRMSMSRRVSLGVVKSKGRRASLPVKSALEAALERLEEKMSIENVVAVMTAGETATVVVPA